MGLAARGKNVAGVPAVSFADKLWHFTVFVGLTCITFGVYLIWFVAVRVAEHTEQMERQTALLRQIRDEQRAAGGQHVSNVEAT